MNLVHGVGSETPLPLHFIFFFDAGHPYSDIATTTDAAVAPTAAATITTATAAPLPSAGPTATAATAIAAVAGPR